MRTITWKTAGQTDDQRPVVLNSYNYRYSAILFHTIVRYLPH